MNTALAAAIAFATMLPFPFLPSSAPSTDHSGRSSSEPTLEFVTRLSSASFEFDELVGARNRTIHGFRAKTRHGENVVILDELLGTAAPGSPGAVSVTSTDRLGLLWNHENAEASIYRDGIRIGQRRSLHRFFDSEVDGGSEYFSEVHLTSNTARSEGRSHRTEAEGANSESGLSSASTEGTILGLKVVVPAGNRPEDTIAALRSAGANSPSKTTYRYRTFIKDTTINAPHAVCTPSDGEYRFLGDNRSWAATGGGYRTYGATFMDRPAKKLTFEKKVGTSKRQKRVANTWVNTESKTASSGGIHFTPKSMTSTQAKFYMYMSVANPFCHPALTA